MNVLSDFPFIVLLPLSIFLSDILLKWYFGVPIDDIGADLCAYAAAFNVTTILLDWNLELTQLLSLPGEMARFLSLQKVGVVMLFVSMVGWLISLHVVGNRQSASLTTQRGTQTLTKLTSPYKDMRILATVCFGLLINTAELLILWHIFS